MEVKAENVLSFSSTVNTEVLNTLWLYLRGKLLYSCKFW